MAATSQFNQNYIDNTLIPNYGAVAYQTELGGNAANLSGFHYAGGNSTYWRTTGDGAQLISKLKGSASNYFWDNYVTSPALN
jgi:hypothetical protein